MLAEVARWCAIAGDVLFFLGALFFARAMNQAGDLVRGGT